MSTFMQVPHLTTALNGPLRALEKSLLQNQHAIESWLREQWQLTPPPLYSSVDLRNAGFKVAPVDTNLFSAGFNNLNPDFMPLAIQAAQATISQRYPRCQRIILIPENHTRNPFYFESLITLQEILVQAGYAVRIGSLREDFDRPQTFDLPSGKKIILEPLKREGNRVKVDEFSGCLIVLNNDLADGIPAILENLEPKITPPLKLGWAHRLKSQHFYHYEQVSNDFAKLINMDPWFIQPLFMKCENVDFMERSGETCLMHEVDVLLKAIQRKYDEYNLQEKPFVVIKADAGTYGMGVMMVHDANELKQLNRKQRTNMAKTKGNQKIERVIVQEGVHSFETYGEKNSVAEPVVYMIGQHVIGGFYRVHKERSHNENLNAPGMHFEPLAFAKPCNNPNPNSQNECDVNRFYSYGVIARLAALAAARECAALGA